MPAAQPVEIPIRRPRFGRVWDRVVKSQPAACRLQPGITAVGSQARMSQAKAAPGWVSGGADHHPTSHSVGDEQPPASVGGQFTARSAGIRPIPDTSAGVSASPSRVSRVITT